MPIEDYLKEHSSKWDKVTHKPGVYIKRENQSDNTSLTIEESKASILDSLSDKLTEKQKKLIRDL